MQPHVVCSKFEANSSCANIGDAVKFKFAFNIFGSVAFSISRILIQVINALLSNSTYHTV